MGFIPRGDEPASGSAWRPRVSLAFGLKGQVMFETLQERLSGILDKLKFWQSDNKDVVEQYRITVKENAGKSEVRVLDKGGKPDGTTIGTRIVTLLHEQLR